jgi:hypothetical protein
MMKDYVRDSFSIGKSNDFDLSPFNEGLSKTAVVILKTDVIAND